MLLRILPLRSPPKSRRGMLQVEFRGGRLGLPWSRLNLEWEDLPFACSGGRSFRLLNQISWNFLLARRIPNMDRSLMMH
jgi:hypothetical protein